jgi:hypothetical protein
LLTLVEAAERGLDGVAAQLEALQIPHEEFNGAMADAAGWMQGALGERHANG